MQQGTDGGLSDDLNSLFIGGWQPDGANGTPAAGWGRNDHSRDPPPGPDVCWDRDGRTEPLGLTELDDEEREVRIARLKVMRLVQVMKLIYWNSSSRQRSIHP